jgi:hypothetical protein
MVLRVNVGPPSGSVVSESVGRWRSNHTQTKGGASTTLRPA